MTIIMDERYAAAMEHEIEKNTTSRLNRFIETYGVEKGEHIMKTLFGMYKDPLYPEDPELIIRNEK